MLSLGESDEKIDNTVMSVCSRKQWESRSVGNSWLGSVQT